ncbi:hypothetical protein N136_03178 [Leifsonia aquatica ATCC 14665]|uniref:Uncharacterized protein n=1 Tax=Leifsonia aquatica ATCC 14665 TaxID=1358026 RepID=U2RNT0_LEIAQ|nr:hypothetical protein N136_03178 [Leifsonia aquatica ATCC 14665]
MDRHGGDAGSTRIVGVKTIEFVGVGVGRCPAERVEVRKRCDHEL